MISIPSELARSALDAAPDALVIIDSGGVIQYSNRQVAALFGYSHQELIGLRVEALMPGPCSARRRDGTTFPVEVSWNPIEDSEEVLIAGAIRDATDRQRVEADLIVARDTARSMQEVADRASQSKSRFLATASHDLRQPLQALAMLNGTLRRLINNSTAADVLTQQEHAISAMTRLLNALSDICKLESGVVKPVAAPMAGGVKVLLVEDDLSVRRATSLLLEMEGYAVTAVASLPEALQHAQSGHGVDLLVSDFHLSQGVTGTHVISAVRGVLGASLPVVLATGDTSPAIKHLARDPYLRITNKPIRSEELLGLLPALLAV